MNKHDDPRYWQNWIWFVLVGEVFMLMYLHALMTD